MEITFALFGKLHAQLQLLSLAFPAKMLVTLGVLAMLSQVFPRIYEGIAAKNIGADAAGGRLMADKNQQTENRPSEN